jgi:hypothetical protein
MLVVLEEETASAEAAGQVSAPPPAAEQPRHKVVTQVDDGKGGVIEQTNMNTAQTEAEQKRKEYVRAYQEKANLSKEMLRDNPPCDIINATKDVGAAVL